MTRGRKLGEIQGPPRKPPEDLFSTIVGDVIQTAKMPTADWLALSTAPMAHLAIPVTHGREYHVTQTGVDAAHELTQQMWEAREDLRQTIARAEFDRLSFTAIGLAISHSRAHLQTTSPKEGENEAPDSFFLALADDYVTTLDQLANQVRRVVDRHIPCHLFDVDQNVPGFSVGPVEFIPRNDWLNRFVTNPVELAFIRDVETGAMAIETLKKQALSAGRPEELYNAWSTLTSLRGFGWIATVRTVDHELSQSHTKASTIVGLAIDVIGLRFAVEDARCFALAGRESSIGEDRIATTLDGKFLRGTRVRKRGLSGRPGALATMMQAEQGFFDAAGYILDAYMQGRQSGRASHLVERWANALYWVGDARREQSDFMATVNYGCAADGLSGAGGNYKLITEFAEAALNPQGDATLALSISNAVKIVYQEGRNKLAHGEMPGLFEDLSKARGIGDSLLCGMFDIATAELGRLVANSDDTLAVSEKHAYRAFIEKLRKRA